MNWRETYNSRLTSADEAVKVVKSGDDIIPGHAASESELLMNALVKRYLELENVTIIQGVTIGSAPYCKPEMKGHFILKSMFAGGNTRESIWENRGTFFPLMFHDFPRAFREGHLGSDVFFTMVSPPDEHGYCSLGMSVDHSKELVKCAKIVVAEVNPNVPRTYGDTFVHVSDLDYIVENDGPILELKRFAEMDETTQLIGKHVASLIKDGDTLQLGAGTIPDAVLYYLKEKNDLGIHTEMFSDGLINLIEAGNVNCSKKTLFPGKIVTTFAEGTKKVYEYINMNPMFLFFPVDFVNDSSVIAKNDNMVAINAALEVDLGGQVCAEAIGTKQYSGIGGQLDFIRGAAASKNGRPVIVLPSTAKNGTISRISCQFSQGTPITTTRNDVHWVVTEYGAVNLFCKSEIERAEALIGIAHPNFRSELKRQYREAYGRVI
ncbi:acetyl-CoA hydrolase/transferase family protein [Desulfosporosinus fructosivorans]|uniref:Acetyl-CoA hydrolase/transferase family protein n=1 Tax=Desulfosporosinus fructosivorans TaxID=2018669 RepID=A0A4Z0R562_9FIRM|nr:acetyl-CoA hydrolase/transferase C-terminal domain-containing protein [Desulfosporosinus fructosivorans]TGE37664.1 acetyl-CoA hydrolase/transferase family protein [Desulfosporosinus fructosivorans]